jgi:capsular exopolysaccharide synthesis family protein
MQEVRNEGLDLQRWRRVIWRRKRWLIAVVVLIPAVVYAVSLQLPKSYHSSAKLFVQPTAQQATPLETPSGVGYADAAETVTLLETNLVAQRAARILGRRAAAGRSLLERIDVGLTNPTDTDSNFLTITAQAPTPAGAARVANAFATAVVRARARSAASNIDRTIAALQEARRRAAGQEDAAAEEELVSQIQRLRGLKGNQAGLTSVVERATPPSSAFSPRPLRNTLLTLLVSLLLAAGLVPLLDRLDRRLREPGELDELMGPPLLATIPDTAFPGQAPDWHVREAFQTLRASLTYFNVDRTLSTLVVTSAAQWEGKTTVAVNLAVAYALGGRDAILVDADLRRPQVAGRLGRDTQIGLESVLAGERTAAEALLEVDTGGEGRLRIMPSVAQPPNPAALLGSQRMRSLLAELSGQADVVVIDTPALLAVSDAMPLINQAAGALLVARMNVTTRDAAQRAEQVAEAAGGSVLGTVATGVRDGGVYGYYGYYGAPPEESALPGVAPSSSNGAGWQPPSGLAPEGDRAVGRAPGQSEGP